MKIKGIDLYKRVLEEDETILGKVFEFDDMKIQVVNTFGNLSNEWGLTKYDSQYGDHIFYNSSKKQIDEIFKAEWTEVGQAVPFMEAIKALDSGKTVYVMYQGYKNTFSPKGNQTDWGVAMKQEQDYPIDTEFILHGEWYIED